MCSIEEAWGTIPFTRNKSGVTSNLVQQQMQMNQERQPDVAGQLYTQTDDRRQWAMPENDVVYDDFNRGLLAKPAPEANGISRGVHSKYSREKRFAASHNSEADGVMGKLVTDVDPKYYERTQPTNIPAPGYMELYGKPFTEVSGVALPIASNMNSEQFAEINPSAQRIENKFTPEIITDPRILADADAAAHGSMTPYLNANNANANANANANNINTGGKDMGAYNNFAILSTQLKSLITKIDYLEKKMTTMEHDKSHDIVLFIVLAIFVMFILDNVFNKKMFS